MFSPRCFSRELLCIFAFCWFFPLSSLSQTTSIVPLTSTSNELLLKDLGLTSTDQPDGKTFRLELPDGLTCEARDGTPPSLNFYTGTSDRVNSFQRANDSYTGGVGAGAILSIPLNSQNKRNCDAAYNSYLNIKQLETAQQLYELGVMSEEELQEFANRIKALLLKSERK